MVVFALAAVLAVAITLIVASVFSYFDVGDSFPEVIVITAKDSGAYVCTIGVDCRITNMDYEEDCECQSTEPTFKELDETDEPIFVVAMDYNVDCSDIEKAISSGFVLNLNEFGRSVICSSCSEAVCDAVSGGKKTSDFKTCFWVVVNPDEIITEYEYSIGVYYEDWKRILVPDDVADEYHGTGIRIRSYGLYYEYSESTMNFQSRPNLIFGPFNLVDLKVNYFDCNEAIE